MTSRSRLSGLTARDGAYRITLDQLSPAESTSLLREIVGPSRVAAEPDATAELVRRCGGLPLALRIAADRIADRPHHSIADLTAELARHHRLDVLATEDDENTAVRTVFDWSYRTLPPETARVFRLLSLHPGAVFSLPAAEALVGGPVRPHLDALTGSHLLTEVARDRYQFHDLLRDYAVEQSTRHDSDQHRTEALRRVLAWYLHTAYAASLVINPVLEDLPIKTPADVLFASRAEAIHWFDLEYQNLFVSIRQAADLGHHDLAVRLPMVSFFYLSTQGRWAENIVITRIATSSARRLSDPEVELWARTYLGDAYGMAGLLEDSWDEYEHVRALAQQVGNRRFEAASRHMFGLIHNQCGRPELAMVELDAALAVYREIGYRRGEVLMLGMLGDAYRQQRRFTEAIDSITQAIHVVRLTDLRWAEAWCLFRLGHIHADLDHVDKAAVHLRDAATLFGEIEDRYQVAWTLRFLGNVLHPTDPEQAQQAWREALALYEELNLPEAEELRSVLDG